MPRSIHQKILYWLKSTSSYILNLLNFKAKRRKIKKLKKKDKLDKSKKVKQKKFKPTYSSLEDKKKGIIYNSAAQKKEKNIAIKENEREKRNEEEKKEQEIEFLSDIKHSDHDFICPICLKYIVAATTTFCGHTFCEMCISEYLLFYSKCPLCQNKLRKHRFGKCLLFDSLIEKFLVNNDKTEYEDYTIRGGLNKEWNKNKRVKNFAVGDKIDVRDPSYIWCEGTIYRIINRYDKKCKFIVVHFEGFSEKHDEEISEHSQRFAPLGFYTGRKDVPRYNMEAKHSFYKKLIIIPNVRVVFFISYYKEEHQKYGYGRFIKFLRRILKKLKNKKE